MEKVAAALNFERRKNLSGERAGRGLLPSQDAKKSDLRSGF